MAAENQKGTAYQHLISTVEATFADETVGVANLGFAPHRHRTHSEDSTCFSRVFTPRRGARSQACRVGAPADTSRP